jgi:hypothetical protein
MCIWSRKWAIRESQSNFFEGFILILIIITSICLAFESPLNDPCGTTVKVLLVIDYTSTVFFVLEAAIKMYGHGLRKYFTDVWNVLDFTIVFTSIISFLPFSSKLSFFKVLRMARLLRPLRIISRNENLKISI